MQSIIGIYQGNGIFSLLPTYDETITYDFENDQFHASAKFENGEIDYDAMYANIELQKDIHDYYMDHKNHFI